MSVHHYFFKYNWKNFDNQKPKKKKKKSHMHKKGTFRNTVLKEIVKSFSLIGMVSRPRER